ncbi:MAG TPA: murein biosynthesis integral membrane protein MurJ [Solirubrobacteraceae bacterium]|nr:murein biosynthesis integral membrane protein MurJ [Solirubrobacteraceae bacterium]
MSGPAETHVELEPVPERPEPGRLGRNTAIFAIATGVSRVVGLVREIFFAAYFGTHGPASAFTIANLVPNFVAQLFAQSALSAAFVPVFTDLLQKGRRKEALRLASTLFWIMLIALSALVAVFILAAGVIMPIFIGPKFSSELVDLTVGLSRVLFPIILLLGLNGLLVGILQSYDHFTIPAIAPAVWNAVIIVLLVLLAPHFHGDDRIYAFSVGILVATVVQLGMSFAALGRIDFRLSMRIDWHDPRIRQVFLLMLPVVVGLGIVNLDQVINAGFGSLVSEEAPRAIEAAFRVYMLPQGLFSVAVATVLFPTLSRMASRRDPDAMRSLIGNGMRQINLLMIPAMTFLLVLAEPVVRLLFQRHEFNHQATHLVAIALFWFALSLPFGGLNLLLTRTFFAVQRPWIPTRLAAINIVVDIVVSLTLYRPLGVAGLVIGTVAANAVMTVLQLHRLRIGLNGRLDLGQTVMITARIFVASALLAGVSWGVWKGLESLLGTSLVAQIVSVGAAGVAGVLVYSRAVLVMHVPEAHQVRRLILTQLGRA